MLMNQKANGTDRKIFERSKQQLISINPYVPSSYFTFKILKPFFPILPCVMENPKSYNDVQRNNAVKQALNGTSSLKGKEMFSSVSVRGKKEGNKCQRLGDSMCQAWGGVQWDRSVTWHYLQKNQCLLIQYLKMFFKGMLQCAENQGKRERTQSIKILCVSQSPLLCYLKTRPPKNKHKEDE